MLHYIATPWFSYNSWQFPKDHHSLEKIRDFISNNPKRILALWSIFFKKRQFTHKNMAADVIIETQLAKMFFFSQLLLSDFILWKAWQTQVLAKFLSPSGRRKVAAVWGAVLDKHSAEGLAVRSPPPCAGRRCHSNISSISLLKGSHAHCFLTCLATLLAHHGAGEKHQDCHQLCGHPLPLEPHSPDLMWLPRVQPAFKVRLPPESRLTWLSICIASKKGESRNLGKIGGAWKTSLCYSMEEGGGERCGLSLPCEGAGSVRWCMWGLVRCLCILLRRGQVAAGHQTHQWGFPSV